MSRVFTKSTKGEVLGVDEQKRRIIGYVSMFGNRDHVGDIVHPGSFAKCIGSGSRLAEGLVSLKYNHELLIGVNLSGGEDRKGFFLEGEYHDDPQSDRIFRMVQKRMIPTFSFKYGIPEGGAKVAREGGVATRHITEVELFEGGPVDPDLAANDRTHVYGSKGISELASALGSLSSLDYSEEWAMSCMDRLTDEEKAGLAKLLPAIEKLGNAARSLMSGPKETEEEMEPDEDEYAEGKAIVTGNIRKIMDELKANEAISRFTQIPALLKAAG